MFMHSPRTFRVFESSWLHFSQRALRPPVAFLIALVLGSGAAFAQAPNLGKPINPSEIAAWDINILPDGTGLPPGSGTPAEGTRIYAAKCSICHGENGKGGPNAALVGGGPIKDMESDKTIANFWPFATTIFDYIRRAMPWRQPRSAIPTWRC